MFQARGKSARDLLLRNPNPSRPSVKHFSRAHAQVKLDGLVRARTHLRGCKAAFAAAVQRSLFWAPSRDFTIRASVVYDHILYTKYLTLHRIPNLLSMFIYTDQLNMYLPARPGENGKPEPKQGAPHRHRGGHVATWKTASYIHLQQGHRFTVFLYRTFCCKIRGCSSAAYQVDRMQCKYNSLE